MKNPLEVAAEEPKGKDPFSPLPMRFFAWTSCAWYPFLWMLIVVPTSIANSDLPQRQLSQLVLYFQIGGVVVPLIMFAGSLGTSRWFRKKSVWIILMWFIMVLNSWATQGNANYAITRAAYDVRKQFTVLEEQKAARQQTEH